MESGLVESDGVWSDGIQKNLIFKNSKKMHAVDRKK